ncbi:MAG: radical SAM protein [Alphaproteobacteria bacterium]|nr:radical SAM protein [Alphaproteobacteria bacterium]
MSAPDAEASHLTKGLVRLTMACNERCPFCNVPAEDFPTRPTAPELLSAAIRATVEAGEQTLTISGGEPTLLRKRLLALIAEARAAGVPFVELQTNAILIDEGYAGALAEAGLTSAFVSLLSHVPEHHDALAGLKGAFPRCLAGLDALIAAGVRVTLNPVTAALTQGGLPDYVDFVAARLPAVRSISVSAVQPHGRAARDLDLLPDYARLAEAVPEARRRARAQGIELLNPYCGLPLCVGWADDPDHSVEALEAKVGREAMGLDNSGNKAHGAPCRACALRTLCGGAWHAYWQHRGGAGIAAPLARVVPWELESIGITENGVQAVLHHPAPELADLAPLGERAAPTRWLLTGRLSSRLARALPGSPVSDLCLRLRLGDMASFRALRQALKGEAERPPQARLRAAVDLRAPRASLDELLRLSQVLHAMGVEDLRLPLPEAELGLLRRALPGCTLHPGVHDA